ncbi:MAG: ABC transporter ATP-binding protein [Planctomycetota bacterium]
MTRDAAEPIAIPALEASSGSSASTAPDTDFAIRTVDVRVDYNDVAAVQGLNLQIGWGEVYGLVGPNGAGKTSTFGVLSTLRRPTFGEAYVAGHETVEHPSQARAAVGYMPDQSPVHDDLKCWEFLDLFAGSYGLRGADRKKRVDECLARVDLTGKRNAMAGTLSRGMTQRLVLAKTLLHDPRVLLLDEPASGLDPHARKDLRDLLLDLRELGKTIVISSHILAELADFCSSVGVMQQGRLLVSGPIDELTAKLAPRRRWSVRVVGPVAPLLGFLEAREDWQAVLEPGGVEVSTDQNEAHAARLLAELIAAGLPVCEFTERRATMQDVVFGISSGAVA